MIIVSLKKLLNTTAVYAYTLYLKTDFVLTEITTKEFKYESHPRRFADAITFFINPFRLDTHFGNMSF